MKPFGRCCCFALLLSSWLEPGLAAQVDRIQSRLEGLQESGAPVVVHVVVALCDNENQGIVPVPATLGNGQDPRSNLYWGARYGVKTHLLRSGYRAARASSAPPDGVLERLVLRKSVVRDEEPIELLVVADAWDGSQIADAIEHFMALAAGGRPEVVALEEGESIGAGGAAAVQVFVGHNGLMDFELAAAPKVAPDGLSRGSIVLACASRPYFLEALKRAGSTPLLLTTGLLAPEAYTLDAALTRLLEGGDAAEIHEAAARAYDAYQGCGIAGARRLFSVEDASDSIRE